MVSIGCCHYYQVIISERLYVSLFCKGSEPGVGQSTPGDTSLEVWWLHHTSTVGCVCVRSLVGELTTCYTAWSEKALLDREMSAKLLDIIFLKTNRYETYSVKRQLSWAYKGAQIQDFIRSSHSYGMRLKYPIGGEKRIQFRCWRDFGGKRVSLPSILKGGEGNKRSYECLELLAGTDFK